MNTTQFILRYTGTVTVNHEYTVDLARGQALQIDWFPDNDLIIAAHGQTYTFNTHNTTPLANGSYLIEIITTENLYELPLRFERGDYLVAGDVVINQRTKQYFTADQIDILPDELVAAHNDRVTRVLFNGDKSATEQYIRKE